MLTRFGRWVRPWLAVPVWSSGVGLARTLLALGTLGTLLATDPVVLMSPLANGVVPPVCQGVAQAGVWCVTGDLAVGRWVSVALLLLAASGWRPRFTALGHWYVSWSLITNVTIQDGGDQVSAVLTLLLLPICLTDPRRWHWQPFAPTPSAVPGVGQVVARVALLLVQIQMAVLYLQASVAKLGVAEWADGTAMYYWSRHPSYGSPPWLRPVVELVTHSPFGVAAITWGSVALEFALALAIVLRPAYRRPLLVAGLLFHGAIALDMGLVSFGAAMSAGLLLYLLPVGHHVTWPQRVGRWVVGAVRRPLPAPSLARPAASAPDRHVFVYDGDCGFCTRSVARLRRLLRPAVDDAIGGAVDFLPARSVDLGGWGLTAREVDRAAYLLLADGSRLAGADAFAHLLAWRGRGGWSWLGRLARLAPVRWLAGAMYRLVAANRHRLPGASVACATVPD